MKKINILLLLTFSIFVLLLFPTTIYANETHNVIDQSSLMTQEEIDNLTDTINTLTNDYNIDILIMTVDSTQGKSISQYASDYYEDNNYGYGTNRDGIVFILSMYSRQWRIETWGYCTDIMSDLRYDEIEDNVLPVISDGNYYSAFAMYLRYLDNYFLQGIDTTVSGTTTANEESKYNKPLMITGSIGASLVISWILLSIQKRALRSVISKQNASDYLIQDSFNLSKQEDTFLYSNTTRTPRPKETKSSCSSSFSGSSGGRGGRGGTF